MDDVRVKTMRARTVSELVGGEEVSEIELYSGTIISMVVQNIDMIFNLHTTCLKWLISGCKPSL